MRRAVDTLLWFLSAEFLLKAWPNGGSVVFLRAVWISASVFLVSIGVHERLSENATWTFDSGQLTNAVRDHLHWLGAIFAGTYTALYARFASQWTYLANLYNQIMSTQAGEQNSDKQERRRVYANWKAGYVEDAEDVHLARKPIYASVIKGMIQDAEVRRAFVEHTVGGETRLERLEKTVDQVLERERKKWAKNREA